jgi:hypothetical protein
MTQESENNNNKGNDPRIRNHVVKSVGFGKRDRRELRERHQWKALK